MGYFQALDINERGDIAGFGLDNWSPVLWRNGASKDLTGPAYVARDRQLCLSPMTLNDRGEIVGGDAYGYYAFLWRQNGVMRTLAPVRKGDLRDALDINNDGQVSCRLEPESARSSGRTGDHARCPVRVAA